MTIMKKQAQSLLKYFILFVVGGIVYIGIELAYRGYTHWSMFLLGGICFIALGMINEIIPWDVSLTVQALIGGFLIVTPAELIFGLLFNKGHEIWDYTNMPLNFAGQICLPFAFAWCFISIIGIVLDDYLRYYMYKKFLWYKKVEEKPKYRLF